MKKNLFYFSIFCLLIVAFFSKQSFAVYKTFEQIGYENVFTKVSDEKYYLKDGIVHVSHEGIFLCVKGEMIPIPSIEADEDGVFIRNLQLFPTCPFCGFPLTPWGTCTNDQCPTKG